MTDNAPPTTADTGPVLARSPAGVPLRECVRRVMEEYFAGMGEHPSRDLYRTLLAEIEPPLLQATLRQTGGNQSEAAKVLGISRSTLRKKLQMYRLDD
jgi:Fis family transcriptional regulator